MSTFEASIKNPKKQLEFYQQLSKQLQQENTDLRIQVSAREEEYKKLEDNWNELKKYIDKNKLILNNPNILDFYMKMQELEKGKSE